MNSQDWFPLGCTVLISLQSKGLSRVFSILGKSKNYNHSSFRKPESRHALFITGTVAEFTKVITQFLTLEPVNMFWRALGQSTHFLLPQRLAMFPQVDVLLQKIPLTITPKFIWTTFWSFLYISSKVYLGVNSSMNYEYCVDMKKVDLFLVSDLHTFQCWHLAQGVDEPAPSSIFI